jgi:hypothetical protein
MSNEKALATFKGLSTLLRPRYERGLLLEDDDLTSAVEYTRNSVRLLFRSLFGCGVICGLEVSATKDCNDTKLHVTVRKGVALDCLGNPIEVPRPQAVTYDADCKPLPPCVWVSVCYLEKNCRPKDVSCSLDEESHVVHTRSHDGFEIKLHKHQPRCACSCAPPRNGDRGEESRGSATCCGDSNVSQATAASAGEASADGSSQSGDCTCYDTHNAGECECDCDCSCVVIGKIHVNDLLSYDTTVRRFIRPVLLGHEQCKERQEESATDAVLPATPTSVPTPS